MAADLERLGVDSLWTGGHVASTSPSNEAMVSLARLSAVTERVRIGTSILLLPLYPPAVVAKQIADLDQVSGGRVILGVGVGGEYPQEFRACQVPIAERGRRTDEAIPLLRSLWTGEEITNDGPYYPMDAVRILPTPVRTGGPPIVVAGRQDVAMRRAALLGDGWMPYLYSPRRYAASVQRIREVAGEHGRPLHDFAFYAFIFVNVDPDGQRAREAAARTMGFQYGQDFRDMVHSVAVAGTAEEVTARLVEFVEAGARHFIFLPAAAGGPSEPIIERLWHDVWPGVRRATGT